MLSSPEEDVLPGLREEDRAHNIARLERSLKLLGLTKGMAAARDELYRATEPLLVEILDTPLPRLRALDLFDASARTVLEWVSDAPTRDAFLEVLADVHYAQAHDFLVGGLPECYAQRFGGCFVRCRSAELESLVDQLNTRYRFWVNEAFKRGGDAVNGGALGQLLDEGAGHPERAPAMTFGFHPEPKRRGRPVSILGAVKAAALAAKESGRPNSEVAKILYHVRCPTPQQVKNVPAIIRHYKKTQNSGRPATE